jgi:hypothetical protein
MILINPENYGNYFAIEKLNTAHQSGGKPLSRHIQTPPPPFLSIHFCVYCPVNYGLPYIGGWIARWSKPRKTAKQ